MLTSYHVKQTKFVYPLIVFAHCWSRLSLLGKMNNLNILTALFIMVASVEADEPPKKGADILGSWQSVEVWDAGVKREAESVKQLQIEFRDDKFVVRL